MCENQTQYQYKFWFHRRASYPTQRLLWALVYYVKCYTLSSIPVARRWKLCVSTENDLSTAPPNVAMEQAGSVKGRMLTQEIPNVFRGVTGYKANQLTLMYTKRFSPMRLAEGGFGGMLGGWHGRA